MTKVQYQVTGGNLSNAVIATGHPDHIRMAGELEYHDRAERDLHPAERRFLRRGRQRAPVRASAVTVDNPPPTTTVVLPSNAATLSGDHRLSTPPLRRRDQGPVRAERREPDATT